MSARILTASPGSVSLFHEADGRVAIETVTDVAPVLADAAQRRQHGATKTHLGDWHTAEIPVGVLVKWAEARGTSYREVMADDRLFKKFLNDPDNASFRIAGGRV